MGTDADDLPDEADRRFDPPSFLKPEFVPRPRYVRKRLPICVERSEDMAEPSVINAAMRQLLGSHKPGTELLDYTERALRMLRGSRFAERDRDFFAKVIRVIENFRDEIRANKTSFIVAGELPTWEMIEAGVAALARHIPEDDRRGVVDQEVAEAIYRAMAACAPTSAAVIGDLLLKNVEFPDNADRVERLRKIAGSDE